MATSVIAFVTDLIFSTKITSTARALHVPVRVARSIDELTEGLASGDDVLVLIDLNASSTDPIEAIRAARCASHPPHIIGFVSHVDKERAEAARQAGADEVMPRSAFSARLPELLGS